MWLQDSDLKSSLSANCLSCWFTKSLCGVCDNATKAKHCELKRLNW